MKKTLTLIPFGGLANRIYAITSAIGFCRDNHIRLKIIWFKDWGMGAEFHDILMFHTPSENVEIIDAKWYHYIYDRPRRKNLWLPYLWQFFAFNKRIYDLNNPQKLSEIIHARNNTYAVSCYRFYEWEGMFDVLKPVETILTQINKQISAFKDQRIIGIHIRRSDHIKSIANSPTHFFIEKINQEIEKDSAVKFYLATDSEKEKQRIKELFGDKIITSSKEARRDSKDGIIDAVIELYTLASTQKIYGSYTSTYSALAAQTGNIPIE